jgi:hypothetical protein
MWWNFYEVLGKSATKSYSPVIKIRFAFLKILHLILDLYIIPSSSVGATARCGLWPVEQYFFIFPYLSPTLSIFSLPTLKNLFLLLLSILF